MICFPAASFLFVIFAAALLVPARAEEWQPGASKWDRLTGCLLVENGADDGDSFYVRAGGKSFLFRLYAVDTPETTMSYPDRVAAQAQHFGITPAQAVQAGEQAAKFTRRVLKGSFTVETCWQDAKGAGAVPRYYAVITINGKDLAELLAAAGLARVYGFTPATPGFSLPRLETLERQARFAHRGAYGFTAKTAAAPPDPNASRLPPTISAYATPTATPAPGTSPGGKVNINTATAAELDAIPGIGPKYAKEIIAGRPYKTVDEIVRVNGIGPKTLVKLAPYLSIGAK